MGFRVCGTYYRRMKLWFSGALGSVLDFFFKCSIPGGGATSPPPFITSGTLWPLRGITATALVDSLMLPSVFSFSRCFRSAFFKDVVLH